MSATITWFGHATIRLRLADERVIFIDPWIDGNPACPAPLKGVPRCDLVVLTHGHADHVGDTARLVKAFGPPVVASYDLCAGLQRMIGDADYRGMNTGGTQDVGGIRVTMTRAYHSSALETPDGPMYAGMPNGVIVQPPGLASVYHAGDTDVFSDMQLIARLFAPKIAILPIGDWFTMGAKGAALAAEFLRPAGIIPVHYGSFPMLAPSADAFREALPPNLRHRLVAPAVGQEVPWTASGIG
jgi:L-ascorbate metabolism protein UlaG (beta-lactamase superfamily)